MLKDELQALHDDLQPYTAADGWYRYTTETPAFFFQSFVNFDIVKGRLVHVAVRGKLAEDKIAGFLKFVSGHPPKDAEQHPVKMDRLQLPGLKMDAALFLPSDWHTSLKAEDEGLFQKTIAGFPIFHSEFSGDETPDEVKSMRRDLVITVDWERSASPKLRMRYNNVQTKGKSSGKAPGLAPLDTVWREFDLLADPKSFIELENYKKMFVRITQSASGKLRVEDKDQRVLIEDSRDEVKKYINSYLLD